MPLPFTFATLTAGNVPASDLDANFSAVGLLGTIPCTAVGTNTIALSTAANTPTISSYSSFLRFSFTAAATNTATTTININGIGPANVFQTNGLAIVAGQLNQGSYYEVAYNAALPGFVVVGGLPQTNFAPQGRLTLTTGVPVLNSNVIAATQIFYTAFVGQSVPIYNGTLFVFIPFTSDLLLTLDTSGHLSGSVYDIFTYNNAGSLALGTGPAWSSGTSRGTGAGTTQIALEDGIWTNANAIILRNNSVNTSSIAVNQATYLGTIFATANGQTGMQFSASASGGSNNVLALYNAYNRVWITSQESDTTANWTYNGASFRAANNNVNNAINFIDGLQQSYIETSYQVFASVPNLVSALISTSLDSSSGSNFQGEISNASGATQALTLSSFNAFTPQIGKHTLFAVEFSAGGTTTFNGATAHMLLKLSIDM